MSKNNRPDRIDWKFENELQQIKINRYNKKLEDSLKIPNHKIERKIVKHPAWSKIKEDLSNWQFFPEKDGQFNPFTFLLYTVVAIFIIAVICGFWLYSAGVITNAMIGIGKSNEQYAGQPGYVNETQIVNQTFATWNNQIQQLKNIAFVLVFGLLFCTVILNIASKYHPIWAWVYLAVIAVDVIGAWIVSSEYSTLLIGNPLSSALNSLTYVDYLILYLPYITAVIGLIGGIFLFVNILNPVGVEL
jgi:hypothetical protein